MTTVHDQAGLRNVEDAVPYDTSSGGNTEKRDGIRRPLLDCQRTCPVTNIGGKDSVKGNRQGSLSPTGARRFGMPLRADYYMEDTGITRIL